MWQDFVLAAVSVGFSFFLIPQARSVFRGHLFIEMARDIMISGTFTSIGLVIIAFTYATLGLWFATATTVATAIVWAFMAMASVSGASSFNPSIMDCSAP